MNEADESIESRYSAKLLFQFRVVVQGDSGIMRTCEERIIVFRAPGARRALAEAKRRGRKAQHDYRNSDGNRVFFEFVGVMDLLSLGPECDDEEVWYDIVVRKQPMERAAQLLPDESELSAIREIRVR
ncbi:MULTISPECIES: DUF4288 domain-containing protein [Lysobacter]|uniref:DUF4288 domain-containing protein n=1 Tax=Lysobacter TaxID=68 RepID=UPI001F3176EF|nr:MULTISPECIES: DUF4288 domain-containing protein [Lysobacter]UJB19070.1 DUF4288 domain-containing protein [Lysobacter capsici]UJQ27205.1 DUF4288 domain-containing protein [Lysobacter gummosus]